MNEPLTNAPEAEFRLEKSESRNVGCILFIAGFVIIWMLLWVVVNTVLPKVFGVDITCLGFPLLIIILAAGTLGAAYLGLRPGPALYPGFYAWIESHPASLAIIPGIFFGTIGVLAGIWAPAIYFDNQANSQHPGAGAGATLVAMFVGTPLSVLFGPIIGSIGGFLAGSLGNRIFKISRPRLLAYGILGGSIFGFLVAMTIFILILNIG